MEGGKRDWLNRKALKEWEEEKGVKIRRRKHKNKYFTEKRI